MTTTPPLLGKTALVTGASRGIGSAIASRLARDGANVIVNYNRGEADAISVTSRLATAAGNTHAHIQADVGSLAALTRLKDAAMEKFGRVDILVLNAGIQRNQALEQITEASYDESFNVNVKGPLFLTQMLAPHMDEGGRVVFFSTSLTTASAVAPNYTLYNATKGAVEQFARTLSKDLGRRGITVNTISPGPTKTELFLADKTEQQVQFFKGMSPLGRLGEPEDIANVVSFLAGPDAAWVSGQNIRVNGAFVV
ncbi:NAD-P-binding protein [Chytriomyces sp. MP71]|nr:NAD-P-binding protein [Chytriomyces sp. MP71]